MKRALRKLLDSQGKRFEKGGALERLYPLFEATDSFFFAPGTPTKDTTHVRDGADLKRVMFTVVIAMIPCALMAMYNTGLQVNLAVAQGGFPLVGWRTEFYELLGGTYSPASLLDCGLLGALYYIPVLLVTFGVGLSIEVFFAIIRRHEVNEGFFVTGMIFPLILPPTVPLWQVALAIAFGVVIGKEVFGGTGYNIMNPALVARAFLFFGYPGQISGDEVWIAASLPDTISGATALPTFAQGGIEALSGTQDWMDAFLGFEAGSMGETSALACLIGAFILLATGIASWRIMLSVIAGVVATSLALNTMGSSTNALFAMPFYWHLVLGGVAFATVFMATDPVTAPITHLGHYIYGFLIGFLIIVIRVLNPAYPEGLLVAILLMNVFAPLIDHYVLKAHIKKRMVRHAR
jgi:Na+-transporting NADH:ubiquinone oxidoreductase subunit B